MAENRNKNPQQKGQQSQKAGKPGRSQGQNQDEGALDRPDVVQDRDQLDGEKVEQGQRDRIGQSQKKDVETEPDLDIDVEIDMDDDDDDEDENRITQRTTMPDVDEDEPKSP